MPDLDILNKIPDMGYVETLPDIDPIEFEKVVRSRRSVRVFTDEKIPDEVVQKCIDLTLLAPNSSNLQSWKFYRVKNEKKKELVQKACLSQPAATTAAELIVCCADLQGWKGVANQMLELFKTKKNIPKAATTYYSKIVPLAYGQGFLGLKGLVKKLIFPLMAISKPIPRGPASLADMRVWAHKTTALGCENMMLAFRAYGYDTCPMEGFDAVRVKKALNLPKGIEPCMVIGAGRRSDKGVYGPQVRMPKEQFYTEI